MNGGEGRPGSYDHSIDVTLRTFCGAGFEVMRVHRGDEEMPFQSARQPI